MRLLLPALLALSLAACPCDDEGCISYLQFNFGQQIGGAIGQNEYDVVVTVGEAEFSGTCPGTLTARNAQVQDATCSFFGMSIGAPGFSRVGPFGDEPIRGTIRITYADGTTSEDAFASDPVFDDDDCPCVSRGVFTR